MGGKSDSIPVFAPLLATRLSVRLIGEFSWVAATPVVMETVAHGTQEAGPKWQKRDRVVPKYRFPIDRWLGQEVVCCHWSREEKSQSCLFDTLQLQQNERKQRLSELHWRFHGSKRQVVGSVTTMDPKSKAEEKPASISLPSPLAPPTKSSEEECIK